MKNLIINVENYFNSVFFKFFNTICYAQAQLKEILISPLEQFEILSFTNSFFFPVEMVFCYNTLIFQILFGQLFFFCFIFIQFVNATTFFKSSLLWVIEFFVQSIKGFIYQNATISYQGYFFLLTEFIVILFIFNISGLMPFGFTLTAQMICTFFFGFTFFFGLNFIAMQRHGKTY